MIRGLIAGLAALAACATVAAQEYPTKPIRVLVPYAPGGVVDTTTRIVTNKITERLGWQIVVDNRPGGNGFIATGIAAKGAPDGYTILSAHTGEFAVSPFVFKGVPFDLDRDFEAVVMLSDAPMLVVVNSQSPINSFKDLVAAARAKPGAVTFGSPGNGSVNHLASEWLAVAAGVKMLHIPYKGGAPAVSAVATNEVVWTIAGLPGVTPHLQAKRVKVLGITTARRTAQTPDWPSAQEGGIPSVDLGGILRSQGHAEGNHRQALHGLGRHAEVSGREGALRGGRRRRDDRHAAQGIPRARQERRGALQEGRAGRWDHPAMIAKEVRYGCDERS